MDSKLIFMVGVAGSGKSSVAEHFSNELKLRGINATIISSDALRAELLGDESDQSNNALIFDTLAYRAKEALENGYVIVDCCNVSRKKRMGLLQQIDPKNKFVHTAYVIATPYPIIIENNNKRERKVPQYVIDRMINNFECPQYFEGFEEIMFYNYFVDSHKEIIEEYVDSVMKKTIKFDQKNHHHNLTLDEHMKCCAEIISMSSTNTSLIQAGRYHDVGKVLTQTFLDKKGNTTEEAHYYGHHNVGAYFMMTAMVYQMLTRMSYGESFDKDIFLETIFYINYHMLAFQFEENDKTKLKYKNIFGEERFSNLLLFNTADKMASSRDCYGYIERRE